MALENKLGITDSAELAKTEERISKARAVFALPPFSILPRLWKTSAGCRNPHLMRSSPSMSK